jgi:hypothetical protein
VGSQPLALFSIGLKPLLLDQFDRSVIIAVTVVGMVKVTVHQVAGVVAVGNRLVSTAGAVHVVGGMTAAVVMGGATVRVLSRDFDGVMLDGTTFLLMVKVAVVQVIDVISMLDGGMAAALSMVVVVMIAMMTHDETPPM